MVGASSRLGGGGSVSWSALGEEDSSLVVATIGVFIASWMQAVKIPAPVTAVARLRLQTLDHRRRDARDKGRDRQSRGQRRWKWNRARQPPRQNANRSVKE